MATTNPAASSHPLAACGGSQSSSKLSYGQNAKAAYDAAMDDFNDGDCVEAEPALHKAIKARKWVDVASLYNGPAYKANLYDIKLARAYDRYAETAEHRQKRRDQHGTDRVDVPQRIEAEPALGLGGGIAAAQRYPAMRDFMQGNRQQQRRRQNHEKLNRIECLHGAIIRRPSRHGPERTR